jgi:DNA (cytosine-5)-methyltransferase 1
VKTIDLFAGGAGMTEGFKLAGFTSVFCNEFEKNAVMTCQQNNPNTEVNSKSILDLDVKEVRGHLNLKRGELDTLIGGPPCQGFSTYGKREQDDPRNKLYLNYINFLEEFRPKTFVIENVAGLLSMSEGAVLDDICSRISQLGYNFDVHLLNASEFGVPQKRKRVFIMGATDGQKLAAPIPTHGNEDKHQSELFERLLPFENVRNAISDFEHLSVFTPKMTHEYIAYQCDPTSDYQAKMRGIEQSVSHHSSKQMLGIRRLRLALLNPGEYGTEIVTRAESKGLPYNVIDSILNGTSGIRNHVGCRKQDIEKEKKLRQLLYEGNHKLSEILSVIDSGGFKNKYRRLHWNEPSHTIVAHMSRDCSDFIHPSLDRFISVREAARIQSFPDRYQFQGSQFQQFMQIGNAVPPLLAKAVAAPIAQLLGGAISAPKAA